MNFLLKADANPIIEILNLEESCIMQSNGAD